MELNQIPIKELSLKPYSLWEDQWFLLCAGDYSLKRFNSMTVSWGSIGVMWNKPFVKVVVRPTRHTYAFIDKYPDFTVCAFPEKYRKTLQILGVKSGKDMDKINSSGLTPCASTAVNAPSFSEAELVLECRKIYWHDFNPEHFIDQKINNSYSENDYHRSYFGEILCARGVDKFRQSTD